MKKNTVIRLFALMLCVLLALPVMAGAEGVADISAAAVALLVDTENVTVSASARLLWDGVEFKKFDGRYLKAAMDNYMKVQVQTPVSDGTTRAGGYEVIGRTGDVWARDYSYDYYYESGIDPSTHIVRSAELEAALREANSVMAAIGNTLLTGGVSAEQTGEGTMYTFTVQEKDVSPLAQAALLPLLRVAASRMGFGYISEDAGEREYYGPYIEFEDEYAFAEKCYRELTGEEMPEEFFFILYGLYEEGTLDDDTVQLAIAVTEKMNEPVYQIENDYNDGIFVIDAEGTVRSFASEEEYILAYDLQYVEFQDPFDVMSVWYLEKYGIYASPDAFSRALYTEDAALAEMTGALYEEMCEDYLEQVLETPGAIGGYVHRNGALETVYFLSDLNALSGYMTPTEKILNEMMTISVASVDGTVSLDAEGRLTEVVGTVTFNVVDCYDRSHVLTVEMSVEAGDYGTTDLTGYGPEMWGVPDYSEWWDQHQEEYLEEMTTTGQPEILTINGVDYSV